MKRSTPEELLDTIENWIELKWSKCTPIEKDFLNKMKRKKCIGISKMEEEKIQEIFDRVLSN